MTETVTFDFETKSYADLPKVGAWVYSKDVSTEVICACYGIDNYPTESWWPDKALKSRQAWPSHVTRRVDMPYDLFCAITEGLLFEAHNISFEYSMMLNHMSFIYGWPVPEIEQLRDTMAVAAYYAMPQALDKLARALGFPGKDPEGGRLITKYSKLFLKTAVPEIPEKDFHKFVGYCDWDVALEDSVSAELGPLPDTELELFHIDIEQNLRGLYLDVDSINNAMFVVEDRAKQLEDEFKEITGLKPSQGKKVKEWFHDQGLPLENLQADYIQEVLDGDHFYIKSNSAKAALQLRNKYNKASTKKLAAMKRNRDKDDGRARFQTRYHGAFTGRDTGSGFGPLNLSKGFEDVSPDQLVQDISMRSASWLDVMYGDAMEAVGKASRHHIKAAPGRRIIAGDFVSVEAVILSCLAYEEWKIEAFRNKDPIYELMGCKIHNLSQSAIRLAKENKAKFKEDYPAERFDGKTGELAFGYQGALGAWRKFDNSDTHSDDRVVEICKGWRAEHPAIVAFWYALERAAVKAVEQDREVEVWTEYMPDDHNVISFKPIDEWLSMRLPNGKRIWYRDPQLRLTMPPWHKPGEHEECANNTCDCEPRNQLTYMAQKEGRWQRVNTYGGKLAENATQATSREVLMPAVKRVRKAGYPVILKVYDEIVSEPKIGFGSVDEFTEIMGRPAGEWAEWFPITVDAWEGDRYKK